MSLPAVFYDVRFRIDGSNEDWTVLRFPVGADIVIPGVHRGEDYEAQICAVAANGRSSTWVDCPFSVAATAREGAAALPVNAVGNIPSVWDVDTEVTFEASTDGSGASTATISVSAGTLVIGGITVAYGASSGSVNGSAGTQKRVYLYYDDPRLQGGSRTLGITESYITSMAGNGRVAITNLLISFPNIGDPPAAGGGGIGGGGGGGGAGSINQDPL